MVSKKSRIASGRPSRTIAILVFSLLGGLAQQASAIIIDGFRVRGPNGASDEYIQLYNETGADHVVAGGGAGYSVAASDGTTRCVIPNGTVIPNHGHYLCVNSVAYSLASYPAGNGTTATGDATYTTDIPDNAGIAIFNTSISGNYVLANRLDAVGSTSEANTLYKEGTGYPALTPFSIDYAFTRDTCGKSGSITTMGTCSQAGAPKDTGNNAADFIMVDTNGTSAGAGQRLGAPGPRNLSSPLFSNGSIVPSALDSCVGDASPPNRVRDFTSDPANNSTFGTLDFRRTFTNNTGGNITRLRYRVIDLTTFPAPSGYADLRPRTSTAVVVTVDRTPCGVGTSNVTVQGTTLEQPPSQPHGGGFDSSLSSGTVTLATPLANGATIDVRFLLGIQQTGLFKLGLAIESLPGGGGIFEIEGCTDGCAPTVTSINRIGSDPTNAASVQYAVTFSESVTGVDATDFTLTATGSVAGASVTNVSGSGANYTVTVNTGTGNGTLRLDVVDDDSIVNGTAIALGGAGAGNGNFTTGQTYTIDKTAPTVTIDQAGAQTDPAGASPINFTVTFSEAVTGFTASDVTLGGTAGATTAIVSGGPVVYNVAVSGMTGNGTVTATVIAAAAVDAFTNASLASSSTDNSVAYTGIAVTSYTAPTATGTGNATASFTGGGVSCSFVAPQFIGVPPGAPPIPPVGLPNGTFPHGLFDFSTTGCTAGSTLTFTILYPQVLPIGAQYWKYGPTPGTPAPHWYVLPATIVGNTATFTITDGGLGDDDLVANGTIVDQGGPATVGEPAAIPVLDMRGLIMLALMMLGAAFMVRRRS